MRKICFLIGSCGLIVWAALVLPAGAGDVTNLEPGLPVTVEDAYPIGYLGREVTVFQQFQRTDDKRDIKRTEGRVAFGFPRNGEIRIAAPYLWGRNEENGFAYVSGEFMYNFNQETLWLPACSLDVGAWLPVGSQTRGYDPMIKALFTKTVGYHATAFQQVHANFMYRYNDRSTDEEEGQEVQIAVGFSRLLAPSLLIVTDLVEQWGPRTNYQSHQVELGLRYQLTPLATVSGGTAYGMGNDSPHWTWRLGFQFTF